MAKDFWSRAASLIIKAEEPPAESIRIDDEPEPEPVVPTRSGRASVDRPHMAIPPRSDGYGEVTSEGIPEGRPFEELYAEAGVPVSAYPAEKLLTVLAGLAAMPESQIRMCVTAMDAADESWTIEDPVEDARAKIEALKAAKTSLAAVVVNIEAHGCSEVEAANDALTTTSESIKMQIDALQAELHAKMDETSKLKADIAARTRAAKEAAARETLRLDAEIGRLNRVPNTFGTAPEARRG